MNGTTRSVSDRGRIMGKLIDLTGKRFGRLLVLARADNRGRRTMWRCRCVDGEERIIDGNHLRRGYTRSCGCFNREQAAARAFKHGHARVGQHSRAYRGWRYLLQRCRDPRNPNYGGREPTPVTVCERWLTFVNYYADTGDPPPGKTLDRIDPWGNYEPGNWKWSTQSEQVRNQRRHKPKPYRSKLEDIQAYTASLARAASA